MNPTDPPPTTRSSTEPFVAQRSSPSVDDGGSQALPVGFRLDEFEIQARLGEGGFGIVYRAWDHSLGQPRAIKEYMPAGMAQRDPAGGPGVVARTAKLRETFDKGLQRFVEEAQTLARFDHPALVRVLRRWEAHGTAYMAMPLYEGPTLREHLRRLPDRPSETWLMQLLAPLTEALAVVHKHHWLHRDIAPDNILLLEGDRPLLLDFGAARQVIGDVTQELTAILKPGFAPVEQYGETPGLEQGPWTDVYALAATVHWAVMGRAPVPSVSRVLVDNQPALVDAARGRYSERFLVALDKALRVDARQRTPDMAAFRADLGLAVRSMPGTSPGTGAHPSATETPDAWARTEQATVRALPSTMEATQVLARTEASPAPQAAPPAPDPAEPVVVTLAQPNEGVTATVSTKTSPATPPAAVVAAPTPHRQGRWKAAVGIGLLAAALAAWLLSKRPAGATDEKAEERPAETASPTAPAPTFDLSGQLNALLAGANPAREVRVHGVPERLSITAQQFLQFELESREDGYLTLLVRGPDGTLTRLLADQPPLFLKAGQRITLPPAGRDRLQAADPVGREEVIAVVSAVPRRYTDLAAGREGSFEALHTGTAATARLRAWKGPTPLLAGQAEGPCEGTACTDFGAVRFGVDVVR